MSVDLIYPVRFPESCCGVIQRKRMCSERRQNGEDGALNTLNETEESKDPSSKVYRSINMNHYATKKSAAQSMLDVALLMANSSQLKTVLYVGPQYRFYTPLIALLSLSIMLQIIVGLLLIFIAVKNDLNDIRKHSRLNSMNNLATVLVFCTVLINIFITALGFEAYSVRSSLSHVVTVPETQFFHRPIDLNVTGDI